MATFKERFLKLKNDKDISLDELAKIFHTNKSSLSRIINGKLSLKTELLEDMANYFDVPVEFLLGKTDEPKIHKNITPLESKWLSIENKVREKYIEQVNKYDFNKKTELLNNLGYSNYNSNKIDFISLFDAGTVQDKLRLAGLVIEKAEDIDPIFYTLKMASEKIPEFMSLVKEEENVYICIAKKAQEKGVSPELLERLIDAIDPHK